MAGQQAAASHTAAAATPLVTRKALLEQPGSDRHGQPRRAADAAALLGQPGRCCGRGVAMISDIGTPGLAADACTSTVLTVHKTSSETRRRLRALVPSDAAVNGPVDTTAAVHESAFRRAWSG